MKKNIVILAFTIAVATSCADMLDLTPYNAIAPSAVTESDVPQLRIGMYWKVQELPGRTTYILDDLLGGNLTPKNNTSTLALANTILNAQSSITEDAWAGSYKALYQVNNVIAAAEGLPDGDTKNLVLGEAYYFRAFLHLGLVTHFGDVPLMLKNTSVDVPRDQASKVWSAIETDLDAAIALLGSSESRYYVSQDAATALKARVMLYRGKNEKALLLAESLIEKGIYKLDSFEKIFRGGTDSETIFAFKCATEDGSGITLSTLFYSYNHPNKGSYVYQPAQDVMTLFSDTDSRKEITVTTLDNLNFINKYPSGQTGSDPVIISRIAEMYLVSAEAAGLYEGGLQRLNELRAARGLEAVSPRSEEAFAEAVALERRKEFVGENHLFYDLVRTGKAVETLGIQDYQTVLPVPESELQNNSELTQNDRY